jgi:hypothetical protein
MGEETIIIGLCTIPDTYSTDGFLKAGALAVLLRIDHLHPRFNELFPKALTTETAEECLARRTPNGWLAMMLQPMG